MEKKTIEKIEKIQRILNNVGDKMLNITSANVAHDGATHRSTLYNVRTIIIPDIIEAADDNKLKELMNKVSNSLESIDMTIMSRLSPSTLTDHVKKMTSNWLKHLSDEVNDYIVKYVTK